jgi:hypothetical protein
MTLPLLSIVGAVSGDVELVTPSVQYANELCESLELVFVL